MNILLSDILLRRSIKISMLPLLACLLGTPCLAEEVVKWVDDQGRVHFGDAPPQDKNVKAEIIEVKEAPKLGLTEEELEKQRRKTREYQSEIRNRDAREREMREYAGGLPGNKEQSKGEGNPSPTYGKPQTREDCRNQHPSQTAARVRCFKTVDDAPR